VLRNQLGQEILGNCCVTCLQEGQQKGIALFECKRVIHLSGNPPRCLNMPQQEMVDSNLLSGADDNSQRAAKPRTRHV
jgi:hypothetical protein